MERSKYILLFAGALVHNTLVADELNGYAPVEHATAIPVELSIFNNGYADLLLLHPETYQGNQLLLKIVPKGSTENHILQAQVPESRAGYVTQGYSIQWTGNPRKHSELTLQVWSDKGIVTDAKCSVTDLSTCTASFTDRSVSFEITAENSFFD